MKIAVIGLGVIGKVHLAALQDLGMVPAAVCDIDQAKAALLPGAAFYTDWRKMLEAERPEAVHICTPHYLHAEMTVECLSRNIHVLCEKPLCIREEDIASILKAEEASSATLGVCFQNRYKEVNRFVKAYLAEHPASAGEATVFWHRDAAYYASGPWRGKWATEGGGVLINQALHTLDLLVWFLGEPETVDAALFDLSLQGVIEVEDTAFLKASGGAEFVFSASNAAPKNFPVEISLRCGKEWLHIRGSRCRIGDREYLLEDNGPLHGKEEYGTGHPALIEDFYRCLKEGRPFPINGKEGAKAVRVVLKAYESGAGKLRGGKEAAC